MITKYTGREGKRNFCHEWGISHVSHRRTYHYVAILVERNWCVLCTLSSSICQPIAISRPSWRNRGALYTEYGVQIRCVRRDQSSSVGDLPPSPSLSSLPLPSLLPSFAHPPLSAFPCTIRHSTQPSFLSLPPSCSLSFPFSVTPFIP